MSKKVGRPFKNGELANERKIPVCYRVEPENKKRLQMIVKHHRENGNRSNSSLIIDNLIEQEFKKLFEGAM